jgi:hypothetical protein
MMRLRIMRDDSPRTPPPSVIIQLQTQRKLELTNQVREPLMVDKQQVLVAKLSFYLQCHLEAFVVDLMPYSGSRNSPQSNFLVISLLHSTKKFELEVNTILAKTLHCVRTHLHEGCHDFGCHAALSPTWCCNLSSQHPLAAHKP